MKINKEITVESLFKNYRKTLFLYSPIEDSEVAFERNDAGLKRLSQVLSEQTSDSSAFLNAMRTAGLAWPYRTSFQNSPILNAP
jgi:hypothetical protein